MLIRSLVNTLKSRMRDESNNNEERKKTHTHINLDEFSTQVSYSSSSCLNDKNIHGNRILLLLSKQKKLNHDVISTNTFCRFLFSYLLRVTIDKQARSVRTISSRLL